MGCDRGRMGRSTGADLGEAAGSGINLVRADAVAAGEDQEISCRGHSARDWKWRTGKCREGAIRVHAISVRLRAARAGAVHINKRSVRCRGRCWRGAGGCRRRRRRSLRTYASTTSEGEDQQQAKDKHTTAIDSTLHRLSTRGRRLLLVGDKK